MTEFYRGGDVIYEAIRLDDKDAVFHAARQEIGGDGPFYRTDCGHIGSVLCDWRDQCGVPAAQRCVACRWIEPPPSTDPRP